MLATPCRATQVRQLKVGYRKVCVSACVSVGRCVYEYAPFRKPKNINLGLLSPSHFRLMPLDRVRKV